MMVYQKQILHVPHFCQEVASTGRAKDNEDQLICHYG